MEVLKECLALCEKVEHTFSGETIPHLKEFYMSLNVLIEKKGEVCSSRKSSNDQDESPPCASDDEDEAPPCASDDEAPGGESDDEAPPGEPDDDAPAAGGPDSMSYISHIKNAERTFREEEYEKCEKHCTDAISKFPDSVRAYRVRFKCRKKLMKEEEAMQDLLKAQSIDYNEDLDKDFGRQVASVKGKSKAAVPMQSSSTEHANTSGGLPDISQLMKDPMIMQMTQNLMKNPEFMKSVSSMAENMHRST